MDADSICKDCGHYTVTLTRKAENRTEMYSMLRLNKPEVENEYIISDSVVSSCVEYYSNTKVKTKKASSKRKFTESQMEQVKKLLKEKKFTQKEIADKVGIKSHTVSNIKNGKYNI